MLSVAVTRPDPQAAGTAARLRAAGLMPRRVPLLARQPGDALRPVPPRAILALTSRTAPHVLAPHDALKDHPVYAVGPGTAAEAERAGFRHVTHADGDVDALAAALIRAAPNVPVIHMSGEHQRGDLTGTLTRAGIPAERHVIYAMRPADSLPAAPTDIVTLYSPRTAEIFARLAAGTAWRGVPCVALSEEVAKPLRPHHAVTVAHAPNEPALLAALQRREEITHR